MKIVFDFLKPSWLKLLFLVELPAFVLIELFSRGSQVLERVSVFLFPLGLYYLAACGLIYPHQTGKKLGSWRTVLSAAALLLLLDQSLKVFIFKSLAVGQSIPLVPGNLHLAHAQNLYGSWLLQKLSWDFVGHGFLMVVVILSLLVSVAAYRYYIHQVRRSLLADMAFVFILAAFASAFVDIGVRGFTVDFIQLPGYVVADLKDIYLWFGIACLLAEMFDSPGAYWKMSPLEFFQSLVRMIRFQFQNEKSKENTSFDQ